MTTNTVYFPKRFQRASEFYLTGRPTYPSLLIERVATRVGLSSQSSVLDLGTGPGFLAVDFAPFAGEIVAVDPASEMLEVARGNVARFGAANVKIVQGSSFEIDADFGSFRLVTIGRAFHWMDRQDTLRRLDKIVEPGGAIALFSERYPETRHNAWHASFQEIVDHYSLADPAKSLTKPAVPHETVLLDSIFGAVERIAVTERRATPVERLVDRALSFASVWEGTPGSRTEDLSQEIREAVTKYAIDGVVHEIIEGEALLAFRL